MKMLKNLLGIFLFLGCAFACQNTSVPVFMGQHTLVGNIDVDVDPPTLTLKFNLTEPVDLIHVYIGQTPPPSSPGQYPYHLGSNTTFFEIPIGACTHYYMAIHFQIGSETAWAVGPFSLGEGWGSYFELLPCECEQPPDDPPERCCSCEPDDCPPLQWSSQLFAGQHIPAGWASVLISGDRATIKIDWDKHSNCSITGVQEVHLWVDSSAPPKAIGHWTCKFSPVELGVWSSSCEIPNVFLNCSEIFVAVHVAMTCREEDETAFAFGPFDLDEKRWGWYTILDGCCVIEPPEQGRDFVTEECVFTQGFWKNHNRYRTRNQYFEWPISEETLLCGETWLNILYTPTRGDPWMRLAHQYIASQLNVALGADSSLIEECLEHAEDILNRCNVTTGDLETVNVCQDLFDSFNNGEFGTNCSDIPYQECGSDACLCQDETPEVSSEDGLTRSFKISGHHQYESNCQIQVEDYETYQQVYLTGNHCGASVISSTSPSNKLRSWIDMIR